MKYGILACSAAMGVFHILTAVAALTQPMTQRSLYLGFALALIFLYAAQDQKRRVVRLFCCLLAGLGMAVNLYVSFGWREMSARTPNLLPTDYVFGILLIGALLLAAYQATGPWLPLITLAVIVYAYAGPALGGLFRFSGISPARFLSSLYFGTEGIYGVCTGVSASYVFMFILYSQCLLQYGAGDCIINLSQRLFSGRKGSAGKSAVFSSALFGMLTVRARMNISGTGYRTIPVMKQVGHSPEYAGGVVAAAAVGGKLTPPLLSVSAFFMATKLGISYGKLCLIMILPAALFYLGLFLKVYLKQKKAGYDAPADVERPSWRTLLAQGWIYLFSVAVLVAQLLWARQMLVRSVFWAIVALLAANCVRERLAGQPFQLRRELSRFFVAVEDGCETAATIAVATACLGVIFGVLYATGLNLRFTALLLELTGGSQTVLLILTLLGALILGGHAPGIAVYITIANLMVPCLMQAGITATAAHVFIFYYVSIATVAPSGGDAARVAARIAQANQRKTRLYATAAALPGFLLPLLFVFQPALLGGGTLPETLWVVFSCAVGIIALVCGLEGYGRDPLSVPRRGLLLAAGVCALTCQPVLTLVGSLLLLLLLFAGGRSHQPVNS